MRKAAILICALYCYGASADGEGQPGNDPAAKRSERQAAIAKSGALSLKLMAPGMGLAELREIFPEMLCSERDEQALASCSFVPQPRFLNRPSDLDSLAGMSADSWSVKFDQSDRLALVTVNMSSGNFPDVLAATREKYGKPLKAETTAYQNGFGAKYTGRSSRWNKGAAILEIDEYHGDRNTMQVRLGTRAGVDGIKKFASDVAKKRGAKDL